MIVAALRASGGGHDPIMASTARGATDRMAITRLVRHCWRELAHKSAECRDGQQRCLSLLSLMDHVPPLVPCASISQADPTRRQRCHVNKRIVTTRFLARDKRLLKDCLRPAIDRVGRVVAVRGEDPADDASQAMRMIVTVIVVLVVGAHGASQWECSKCSAVASRSTRTCSSTSA